MPRLFLAVLGLLGSLAALCLLVVCRLLGQLSRAWDDGLAERVDLFESSFERAGR